MIKKMMALLAAISCAIGAWADVNGHLSGTDFSGLYAGSFVTGRDDSGEETRSTYWFVGDTADFEGTIVTNLLGEKFLDFESNITNPLYRTINNCKDLTSPSQFTATPIGDGLFIDTHVQFTPYLVNENHPAPTGSGEDKLIVWVRETEVDGDANLTNLIITAGYVAQNGNVSASNYVANLTQAQASALCSGQHRLTIKSYQNITANSAAFGMGFVVYIDRAVVEYIGDAFADGSIFLSLRPGPDKYYSQGGGHNKLLPSLMSFSPSSGSIDDYAKLSAVGYAGMGKIGDVFFDTYATDYPEFAGDDRSFSVQAGPDIVSYMYNDLPYSGTNTHTAPATAASVIISNVTYASGYKHKDDLWRNEGYVVSNRVDASGKDYGTFYFANGQIFTLIGFQANYMVVVGGETYEFQTLLGTGGALEAALVAGGTLVLNNDIVITEGDGYIALNSGTLTIDLNGHTLQGTHTTWATIENLGGTLTITDTSSSHTGKLLDSPGLYCLAVYEGTSTTLDAGTYENIYIDDYKAAFTLALNGGSYYDAQYATAQEFYLKGYATTTYVMDEVETDVWYAILDGSGPVVVPCTVTFTTNHVDATSVIVNSGDELGAENIPAFTGGSWDAPAPTGASIITSDTNFNYTIPYSLTYVTAHGVTPDGATYTNGAPNFALAAAPTADGWQFNGWLIGSDVFDAGDSFVVADHLEDTTATAVWTPVAYTLTYTTEHGDAPAAVSYTVESNNFALAAAPTAEGWTFAGWVIGSVTNEASATFVVADHLENTTATAVWTPADPWAPESESAADVAAKVDKIFGAESEVAANVTTYAEYEALVTYIKSVTSQSEVPTDLTTDQKTWMWKSYILGADPLFDAEPAVQITSLTANATAGKWDFTVKVTEGESTDAYNVAANKVGALVKIRTSLSTGTWDAPTAGNIEADKLLGGNMIKVTVNFGDGTSGFMQVAE